MLRDVTGPTVRPGGLTLTREAADRCDLNPGARVLDIGCGTGATVVFLTTEKRWRVAGLDRSDILLKDGRATHDDMPLMIGDAQHLPLPGGCLDAVFMECVLSLAEMPARVLAECERVLVPGGRLALSDIYARNPLPPDRARLPVQTCLNGAVGEDRVKERVLSAGFAIHSWADHSRLLQQLAGQLIFRYGSQAAFWSRFCSEPPTEAAIQTIKAMRPGYYLLIARKTK